MTRPAVLALATIVLAHTAAAQFVQQGNKLVGTGAVPGSWQGQSVAISADGTTAIVGGDIDDELVGAAWVFTRSGAAWTQQGSKLVGAGAAGRAHQGRSVAISADGNTAIVGGWADNDADGAAWVFTRMAGVWSQQGEKLVGTGAVGHAEQGWSVGISADGNTAILGGFTDNSGGGAAWVFTRQRGVWSQQGVKLVGADVSGPASQGCAVALSGDGETAIVGGESDETASGAAWVFTRSGGVWSQQGGKLIGTGATEGYIAHGSSVAISGDGTTAIVGGPGDYNGAGAAWVFTRVGGTWSQQGGKLVGRGAIGAAYQGYSVAISADGNTSIVGGVFDNSHFGAAWAYARSGGMWSQIGDKLVGTDAVGNAQQGVSVAISGDGSTALVGGNSDAYANGAAWIFVTGGCAAPVVLIQPQSGTVQAGLAAALSVLAAGTAPFSYQWYQGASGDTSHPVGTNASSFTTPVLMADASYWVRVSNSCGHTDSASASVSVCSPPSISLQPQSQNVPAGQGVTLSVGANGTAPLSYQWYQGLSGDTSSPVGTNSRLFTIPELDLTTSYWVRVSNGCGQADSATATLTMQVTYLHFNWVAVASHNAGLRGSQWRSDLGILNPVIVTAHVQITFFGSDGAANKSTFVAPGAQLMLADVVGQLDASGSGALEISSDWPVDVTARTYNQVSSAAGCDADGTQGQDYPAVVASDGLSVGQAAYLPGLSENASYRCNIGLVNTGADGATVLVELYGGDGTKLGEYPVSLAAGQWAQETQPFRAKAGQTAMDRGFAKITVQSGSGVFGFASVIDNVTNDPTTVAMQPPATAQFVQQGDKLVGSGATAGAAQGSSVAISADGTTAIVGGTTDNGVGAAWVFTRSEDGWSQQGTKLVGTGAIGQYPLQGASVALSRDGNTAIVGGPNDNSGAGAAWVFTRTAGVWSQQGAKLVATDATNPAGQGWSVAISGDGNTAVVGGPTDRCALAAAACAGSAWVFTRSGSTWSQQGGKLVANDAVGRGVDLGWSVAISEDGGTVIVGGPSDEGSFPYTGLGAAWVFTRGGGAWVQQGPKLVGTGAEGSSYQGASVAISADGNTAIVGGPGDNRTSQGYAGAAWVFTRTDRVWSQQGGKLLGTGGVGSASQGTSVAISADGNTVVVGGPGADQGDIGPIPLYGLDAAWVFTRNAGIWSQDGSKLVGTGASGTYRAGLGTSVAVSGDGTTVVSGGPFDDWPAGAGAAWVFSISSSFTAWIPVASHANGLDQSRWRSDLGVLNAGAAEADVMVRFFGSGGVLTTTVHVSPGEQSMLTDVVGLLGGSGSGAIEAVSDQPVNVTARTYDAIPSGAACYADGTQGQDYPELVASDGLSTGQRGYLTGLSENAAYRCNVGLVNVGSDGATVLVELFNGAGAKLAEYTVNLDPGQWAQETQPFKTKAGQTAMDGGYARITVQAGSGVFGFASMIDNITNDPTTVTMQR